MIDLRQLIRDIPDFPKPGIVFKDIMPLVADGPGLRQAVDEIAAQFRGSVDAVLGIESRGFIFGAPVAYALGVGLAVVRKRGKLPFQTLSVTYDLEYGTDTLEIHRDALGHGARVLVVDDLLATGGTAKAAVRLVEQLGGTTVAAAFLIELSFLDGRKQLEPVPCFSLIQYDSE